MYRWLKKHNIPIREKGTPPEYDVLTDREWLQDRYVQEEIGICRIATSVGCSPKVVRKWLDRHGIETRPQPSVFSNERPEGPAGGYFGPNWDEQRSRALERDRFQCRMCGLDQEDHRGKHGVGLHVHHITPRVEYIGEDGDLDYQLL